MRGRRRRESQQLRGKIGENENEHAFISRLYMELVDPTTRNKGN